MATVHVLLLLLALAVPLWAAYDQNVCAPTFACNATFMSGGCVSSDRTRLSCNENCVVPECGTSLSSNSGVCAEGKECIDFKCVAVTKIAAGGACPIDRCVNRIGNYVNLL